MKVYSGTLLLTPRFVLVATFMLSQVAAQSDPGKVEQVKSVTRPGASGSTPKGEDSRAREWEERRRRKEQQIEPPQSRGLEKALLYLEGEGFRELLSIRYKDFYPKFGHISTGSGLAPGLRFFKSNLKGSGLSIETSGAFSFSGYQLVDLQFGRFNKIAPYLFLGPADFGAPFKFGIEEPGPMKSFLYTDLRYRYFPEEDFFGLGPHSREVNETDFLLEDSSYDIVAGYQFTSRAAAVARVGYLQVNADFAGGQPQPGSPNFYDAVSAPGVNRQPDFLHLDSAFYLNYQDTPGNPHKGGVIGVSFSRYDDRNGNEFAFNRFSFDARHYLPLGSRQRVLALRVFTSRDRADGGSRVPFYLQNTLGGNETLRGFEQFRFRDSNLLYLSAEYRWEAAPAVEFAVFYDTGKVFPEDDDFNFENLRKSIGAGIRFKTSKRVILRLDAGHSEGATRVNFRFGPSF